MTFILIILKYSLWKKKLNRNSSKITLNVTVIKTGNGISDWVKILDEAVCLVWFGLLGFMAYQPL